MAAAQLLYAYLLALAARLRVICSLAWRSRTRTRLPLALCAMRILLRLEPLAPPHLRHRAFCSLPALPRGTDACSAATALNTCLPGAARRLRFTGAPRYRVLRTGRRTFPRGAGARQQHVRHQPQHAGAAAPARPLRAAAQTSTDIDTNKTAAGHGTGGSKRYQHLAIARRNLLHPL